MKGVKTPRDPESGLGARSRGGRPLLRVDEGFIAALARRGLGARAIATQYFEEFREPISASSVYRRLCDLRLRGLG